MKTPNDWMRIQQLSAYVRKLEDDVIPQAEEDLGRLTDPDLALAEGETIEEREAEIKWLNWELAGARGELHASREKLMGFMRVERKPEKPCGCG